MGSGSLPRQGKEEISKFKGKRKMAEFNLEHKFEML